MMRSEILREFCFNPQCMTKVQKVRIKSRQATTKSNLNLDSCFFCVREKNLSACPMGVSKITRARICSLTL